jgi:hypothetical protein
VIRARLLPLAFLLTHSAFATFPFPVASTTCGTCALFHEDDVVARSLWRHKVTALVSGQESDPTQITVSALSSEHRVRFNGGSHQ